MVDTALVTLHDSHRRVPHVRAAAILTVTGQWVIAAPWPAQLTQFGLAVTTAQGTQWLEKPQHYEVFDVVDEQPVLRIAAVSIVWPADLPPLVEVSVGSAQLDQAMAVAQVDAVAAIAQSGGPALNALVAHQADPAALQPPAGPAPDAALGTPNVHQTPTPRPQLPQGLCHLFGWD